MSTKPSGKVTPTGHKKKGKKKELPQTVQFDMDVNFTLEISREEWSDILMDAEEWRDDPLQVIAGKLEGEEIWVDGGRAWVCSVDNVSQLGK